MLDAHISRMPNFYDNSAIHFSFPTFNYYAFVLYWPKCSETPIKIRSDIESTSEYSIHACHAASTLEHGKGGKNRTLTTMKRHINSACTPILFMLFCWTLAGWRTIRTPVSPIDHIESISMQQVRPLTEVAFVCSIFKCQYNALALFAENVLLNGKASNTFRSVKFTFSSHIHSAMENAVRSGH